MTIHVHAAVIPGLGAIDPRNDYIRHFAELRANDRELAGGKGANLGELHSANVPVPAGFVITAAAYRRAMDASGASTRLRALASLRGDEQAYARELEDLELQVRRAGLGEELQRVIGKAYGELGDRVRVAVRSSATVEELDSSEQVNQTFTNVRGEQALLDAVVACWRRLWDAQASSLPASARSETRGARTASTRREEEPAIAVVVQHMIDSDKAGVVFSSVPVGSEVSHLVIQAVHGLGGVLLTGQVEPDTYTVDKTSLRLLERKVGKQTHKFVAGENGDLGVALDVAQPQSRVLSEHEVCEVASLALAIDRHYGASQLTEWAIFEGTTYILRTRALCAEVDRSGHASSPR